jgi:DNA-binding CsgD family transcriptional regulator
LASADSSRAGQLAARAREIPPDSTEILARLQALEGLLGLRIGWRHELGQSVIDACRQLPADRAGPLLVTIARVAVGEGDNAVGREAVDALEAVGAGSPEFRELVRAATAFDRNEPYPDAADVERVTRMFLSAPSAVDFPTLTTTATLALEWGRIPLARDLLLRAGELARATGDVDDITEAAFGVAFCDHTLGAWTSAYARAWEVSQLLLDVDLPERLSEALLLQAEIDAARGRSERCRLTCNRVRDSSAVLRDPLFGMLAERREALLDLGIGNLEQAAVRLEAVHALSRIHAMDQPYLSPIPDLVEVYVRTMRTEDARRVARDFLERVGPASPPLPRARALRITGLLTGPGTDYDAAFTESVELDLSVGLAFHAARTMLCHGERLRRDRRRVDGRAKLHAALDIFQRLDAIPWVERCEVELAASGEAMGTPREADPSLLLTPQELQVAILVAEGRRNREIAEMLFLSLRTIESHLSRVFRKLGVDSRTQLAVRMNGAAGDQAPSPRPTFSR